MKKDINTHLSFQELQALDTNTTIFYYRLDLVNKKFFYKECKIVSKDDFKIKFDNHLAVTKYSDTVKLIYLTNELNSTVLKSLLSIYRDTTMFRNMLRETYSKDFPELFVF